MYIPFEIIIIVIFPSLPKHPPMYALTWRFSNSWPLIHIYNFLSLYSFTWLNMVLELTLW